MILEEVLPHQTREDLFINKVITPHERVREADKIIIKRILIKEIGRDTQYHQMLNTIS